MIIILFGRNAIFYKTVKCLAKIKTHITKDIKNIND
ncbi:hypothetical protein BAPCR_pXO2-00100 (plasmid) [Bacillus anthracis]|nr:hypothetical protein BAZ_pXO2-00060 [Bacillus anthracis]BBK99755.1 hypothetical protein BAPCR_pXO2-00100 [Bacillus anthracis]